MNGFRFVEDALKVISSAERDTFKRFFLNKVHIIHYQVPRDIDLNHYFEIMNSRGEQLEKHEIVKAKLLSELTNPEDRSKFNRIWESCSEMSLYIQQKLPDGQIFGSYLDCFSLSSFGAMPGDIVDQASDKSIKELLSTSVPDEKTEEDARLDAF